jgi:hypothetical protein
MWLATFPVAASIDIIFMHHLHTQEKEKPTPRKPPHSFPLEKGTNSEGYGISEAA